MYVSVSPIVNIFLPNFKWFLCNGIIIIFWCSLSILKFFKYDGLLLFQNFHNATGIFFFIKD